MLQLFSHAQNFSEELKFIGKNQGNFYSILFFPELRGPIE